MYRLRRFGKYLFLILIGLLFFLGQNHSAFAAGTGYDSTILAVDVTGNTHVPSETILKAVTHVRLGEEWNPDKINQDVRAIENMGYFASVEAKGEPFLGGIKLIFHVTENPLLKELKIEGLKVVKPASLLPSFTQKKGEVINISQLISDVGNAITNCRNNQGYILIYKDNQIGADGTVTIQLGEVKIRKIGVSGLVKTKDIVVLRELSFKEGDLLNVLTLKDDIQSIYRLGILENINPNIVNTVDPEWVDLTIEVSEVDKLGQFYVGLGYAPASNKLTANTTLSYPNLWGLGRTGSVNLQMGKEDRTFALEYTDPWLLPSHVSFHAKLYYDDLKNEPFITEDGVIHDTKPDDSYLYNLTDQGLDLSLGWQISKKWSFNTSVDFKKVYFVTDPLTPNPLPGDDNWIGYTDQNYWNNGIGFSLYNNQLLYQKDKLIVTGGHTNSVSTTFYSDMLGGNYNYTKVVGETRQFVTPWENGPTLGLRLKYGTLLGAEGEGLPTTEMFSIGGPTTIRGYSDTVKKGTDMFLANGEVRFYPKAFDNIEFVGFYDFGYVTNAQNVKSEYSTYGVGMRFNVPMLGPIRLDYGWNDEGKTQFTFFFGEMF